jgi:hypothetical protein
VFSKLATALLLRRVVRSLEAAASALAQQNALLARLADRLAPIDPATTRAEVHADTGLSTFDPIEAQLAQEFVERTRAATGHIPDDEEILIHLADEKTHDLHQRLLARDQELSRLRAEREW